MNGRTKVFWKNHGTKWWKFHCHVWLPEEKCHGWFFSCLPSNPEQSFPEEMVVPAHGLPPHGSWSRGYQGFAPGQSLARIKNGGSPELGHHRSMEPKKFSIHRTWFPTSCLIFQSHITRIDNVWSQPIQPEGIQRAWTISRPACRFRCWWRWLRRRSARGRIPRCSDNLGGQGSAGLEKGKHRNPHGFIRF